MNNQDEQNYNNGQNGQYYPPQQNGQYYPPQQNGQYYPPQQNGQYYPPQQNQYGQNGVPYQQYTQQIQGQYRSGKAVASLVIGIVCVVFASFFYVSIPGGIVSIILGVKERKKARELGLRCSKATAGLVLGIIALFFGALVLSAVLSFGNATFTYYYSV